MLFVWYVASVECFTYGISQHFIPVAQKEKSNDDRLLGKKRIFF